MIQFSQGQVLGRYELLLPVARGGMAEVWAARLHGTRGFRKLVAIKTILPSAIDGTRMEQMFLAEAELASRIEHPNVVHTLELGEHHGALFLVLEWVDGVSLSHLLSRALESGGMPLSIAVNLVGQACKGLHAAHELTDENGKRLGVVHRDISPQNVLVSLSGTVKLVDFGIAKATQAASTLTEAGEVKGKLAYMAPEQLRGSANVDRRADIFAMGTLLYAMTTGRHPFRGEHPSATLESITGRSSVAPPSSHVEDYPNALEDIVLTALKKDPERRYPTALDMLQALEKAMPEALERSFDLGVAKFVGEVAGAEAQQRQLKIREAGDALDRLRIKSGTSLEPTSPSSLSALAIDGSHATQRSLATEGPASQSSPGAVPTFRPRSRTWLLAGGAVAIGVALGLTFGRGSEERASSASASPAFAAEPVPGVPHASPSAFELDAEATPESGAPAPSASASAALDPRSVGKSKAPAKPRAAARPRTNAPSAPAPAAAQSTASAASAPPVAPNPAPNRKPNAWDPDSFGARQ